VGALSHYTLLHTRTFATQGELLKKNSPLTTVNIIPAAIIKTCAGVEYRNSGT
jgi:hypothetical protein